MIASLTIEPTAIVIGAAAGLSTFAVGTLTVRSQILSALDDRIDRRSDDAIEERLAPTVEKVARIEAIVTDGLTGQVTETHRIVSQLATQVAHIEGQVSMLIGDRHGE